MPADLSQIALGPKMAACSERERQFVWHYCLNGGNGAQAARDAGYLDASDAAKVRACQLLQRPRVLDALEEVGRKQFRALMVPAITAMRTLLDSPDHPDYRRTAETVLDRLGLAPKTTVDLNVNGQVTVNHTDAALEDLRIMVAMGASRQALEQAFGHSGLARYERMLAELDGKRGPKLIEGTVNAD